MESLRFILCCLAILGGAVGAIGDSFFNEWAKRGGIKWLLLGYAMWITMASIFVVILKKDLMGPAAVTFLLANVVFVLLISRFYFTEHLSPLQWSGIGCAILALLLMEMGR